MLIAFIEQYINGIDSPTETVVSTATADTIK